MSIKIIATIGPATRNASALKQLKKNGMDIGRINMKHAGYKEAVKISKELSCLKCKVLIDIENLGGIEKIQGLKFDYLALSYTENARQIKEIRSKFSPKKIKVIAKIETKKGIENIRKIISEADGLMVARGDLGANVPLKKLPVFQKMLLYECNKKRKFAITATEMLLSMTKNRAPTRAEVSDVANAVLDGSDALMLSEETAVGRFPARAVLMMREIIEETAPYKLPEKLRFKNHRKVTSLAKKIIQSR